MAIMRYLALTLLVIAVSCNHTGINTMGDSITHGSTQEGQAFMNSVKCSSGIEGKVLIGPTMPVCTSPLNESCYKPYQARILIKDTSGTFVRDVDTNEQGVFRVCLPKGKYILIPDKGDSLFPRAEKRTLQVRENKFELMTINYDTGIR